jgi:hypothetical protein
MRRMPAQRSARSQAHEPALVGASETCLVSAVHRRLALTLSCARSFARLAAGGAEMQAALQDLTKQRTVPNVFIGASRGVPAYAPCKSR